MRGNLKDCRHRDTQTSFFQQAFFKSGNRTFELLLVSVTSNSLFEGVFKETQQRRLSSLPHPSSSLFWGWVSDTSEKCPQRVAQRPSHVHGSWSPGRWRWRLRVEFLRPIQRPRTPQTPGIQRPGRTTPTNKWNKTEHDLTDDLMDQDVKKIK